MNGQPVKPKSISVVGGGTMGTALAQLLCDSGHEVILWVYEEDLVGAINLEHRNSLFLPDVELSKNIHATNSLEEAVSGKQIILSATPSQVIRGIWNEAKAHLGSDAVIVCASKGVETGTAKLVSDVLLEVLGDGARQRLAYLSGPSFAREILAGDPTAVVVASTNAELATQIQHLLSTGVFRVYTTDDVTGVELGGAIKNVVAIAVGIAEGLGLGINSRSALITRGLAEITRLAVACGAQPMTLSGLAGMGDLVLTCTGHMSRNLQVGIRLGKGEPLKDILASTKMVAEGVATAYSTLDLARRKDIEMPITETVTSLLDGEIEPDAAVASLMGRKLRSEKEH